MPHIEIGKIVNTHGLRGHIKVEPWCDGIETFEYLNRVFVGNIEYEIENVKIQKNFFLLKLAKLDTIEEAEKLKNKVICADEDDASFDIMDYLNAYDPTEDYGNKFEYEERCKKIRAAVKPAQAEMLISIALDGMTVADYAELIGDKPNNVSHRYRAALKKLEKSF